MSKKEALRRIIEMAEKYRELSGPELIDPLESAEAILILRKMEDYINE